MAAWTDYSYCKTTTLKICDKFCYICLFLAFVAYYVLLTSRKSSQIYNRLYFNNQKLSKCEILKGSRKLLPVWRFCWGTFQVKSVNKMARFAEDLFAAFWRGVFCRIAFTIIIFLALFTDFILSGEFNFHFYRKKISYILV